MSDVKDVSELPTPALVVDLPTAKRNIARMAAYCAQHNLKLRPHTKTHKSVRMGKLQMDAGANGLTVAKPGEAAVMADATDDLLIAYPAFDSFRAPLLAHMAAGKTIRVAVDSAEAVDRLADAAASAGATIGILVDLDAGFHRTGVQSPEQSLELARHIAGRKNVRLDGLMLFPGHISSRPEEQREPLALIAALLKETLAQWKHDGHHATIVSGGSTPTGTQSHQIDSLTEIRPGTYVYYDMNCVAGGWCTLDDCAARVVCTVVSDAVPGKVVIDAGSKTLAADRHFLHPATAGFGRVVELPQANIVRISEEHGEIELNGSPAPKLGSRVTVIPNHICPCVNLHDRIWFREDDGRLTEAAVDARGRIR